MYRRLVALLLVAGWLPLVGLVSPAHAALDDCDNDDPLGLAGQFTEFIHHDAQRVSDTEGRVAYGGDAVLGDPGVGIGFSVSSGQPVDSVGPALPHDPQRHDVIVGGTLDAFNLVVLGGGVRYGALDPSSTPIDSLGPDSQGPPTLRADSSTAIDFDHEFAELTAKSNAWGELATNGNISGTSTLTLEGSETGLNVFSLTESQFEQANSIRIKVPAGSTILVSVDGTDISLNQAALSSVAIWDPETGTYVVDDHFINGRPVPSEAWLRLRQSLLWNLPAATHVLKNFVSLPGTVLAPQAAFEFGRGNAIGPGHIDGSLIAGSVTSSPGAETHHMLFIGTCLPETEEPLGSLRLVKQISGPAAGADLAFRLALDCDGTSYDQDVELTVPVGDTEAAVTIPDLPDGLVCNVREVDIPVGWQLQEIVPSTVVIGADQTVEVVATNVRELGSLRLVKRLVGDGIGAPRLFALHLDCDGTAFDQDVELYVPDGSTSAAHTVSGLPVGTSCTVTEANPGAFWSLTSIAPNPVVVGSGDPPVTVTATNTRRLGSLTVEKVATGDPVDPAVELSLDLDCTGTTYDKPITVTAPGSPVTVADLPLGLTCRVSEPDLPPGWTLVGIDPAEVVVDDDANVDVTITNAFRTGSLLLRKVTREAPTDDTTFTLSLDCDGTAYDQEVELTVQSGSTTTDETVDDLPVGTTCAIEEVDLPDNWSEVSVTPQVVVVGSGAPVEVTATNDRDSAGLRIVKVIDGDLVDTIPRFTLDVSCSDGNDFVVTVGVPRASAQSSGFVGGLTPGAECSISERDPGSAWDPVTVSPQQVTIGAADTVVEVSFTNRRRLGELQVTKTTTGDPIGGTETFTLDLDCTGTDYDQAIKLAVRFDRAATTATIDELPVGLRCQVTETDVPPGWDFVGITPDDGAVVVGPAGEPPVEVIATNNLGAGAILLWKESVDAAGDPHPADRATRLVIALDCDRVGHDREVELVLPAGQTSVTAQVSGIPASTTCDITEVPAPGWAARSVTPDRVTVGDGQTATVTVVNEQLLGVAYVGKQVVGDPAPTSTEFALRLNCDGTAYDQSIRLTMPALSREAIAPVSGVPHGTRCAITEPNQPPEWEFVDIAPKSIVVGPGRDLAVLLARDTRVTDDLDIIKRSAAGPVDEVTDFRFRVDCTGDAYDGELVVELERGMAVADATQSGVPTGARCKIAELDRPGWRLVTATNTEDATPGGAPAVFVNDPGESDGDNTDDSDESDDSDDSDNSDDSDDSDESPDGALPDAGAPIALPVLVAGLLALGVGTHLVRLSRVGSGAARVGRRRRLGRGDGRR